MKKKFITVALSMVLCLSMGMTALAAPSPSAATPVADKNAVYNAFGSNKAEAEKKIVDAINKAFPNSATAVLDITPAYDGNEIKNSQGGVDIPCDAKKGETWYVIHFEDDVDWNVHEILEAHVLTEGVVSSVKSDGYSPFAAVKVATIASTGTPGQVPGSGNAGPGQGTSNSTNGPASTASGSGSTAAPKTGDFATPIVAEVVALLSVAGIALYVKKSAAR